MADITITLQAAGDAVMSIDNRINSTRFDDGDPRKAYGLPNTFVDSENKLKFVAKPRWDKIYGQASIPVYAVNLLDFPTINNVTNPVVGIERPPTTTAFQLKCDSISHTFDDTVSISPLPAADIRHGVTNETGTPGQLHNIVVALGMRSEKIKLSGFLLDRGAVTASNPRKQTIMNIARMQYLKISRGFHANGWGGDEAHPLNPRAYPCLTIFDANTDTHGGDYAMGREPSGDGRLYRGLITSLSFRHEGGRPDYLFWDMEFSVLQNEHKMFKSISSKGNVLTINRIRLVDTDGNVITTFPTGAGNAKVEIRVSEAMERWDGKNFVQLADNAVVHLHGTDSSPSWNGSWTITNINHNTKTFELFERIGEFKKSDGTYVGNYNEPDANQNFTSFTDGDEGYASYSTDSLVVRGLAYNTSSEPT